MGKNDIFQRVQRIKLLAAKHGISVNEKDIQKIVKIFDKIPDVREEKINKIKEQIASGKYNPPIKDIALAMINNRIEFKCLGSQALNKIDQEFLTPYLLNSIPAGKEYCEIFHKIGSICISDIFQEELTSPLMEIRGSKGSKRFDLMLYNRANSGFWLDMKKSHNITHVVFEFKNWKKNNHIKFGEQIGRYTEQNRAIILISRNEPNERLFHECSGIFKKTKNFVPLLTSDKKIFLAAQQKKNGTSPSSIFEEAYLRLQAA